VKYLLYLFYYYIYKFEKVIDLKLDRHSSSPFYLQITEQVRQLIATEKLKPGDHLPPVRQMANFLKVNQNTVVRAYLLLEQEKVVIARRGGGTVVTTNTDDPNLLLERQRRLSDMVSNDILKVLSQGYSPEEAEAAFYLHLARWREERKVAAEKTEEAPKIRERKNTICVVGSHDLALNILIDLLKKRHNEIEIDITHAGSLGGLIALQEERAHLAGIHLLDEETGEYNYPYVKRVLPGREIAIVHLVYRIQGLMFARGNPRRIEGLADLKRPGVTFVNRQKGSGTRVLLDIQMHQLGISPLEIKGYEREMDTHLAVGLCVARGEADVALGIEAAARSCNLDFMPLFRERYDLVMPMANYRGKLLAPLLSAVISDEFREVVNKAGGYDTSQTGMTTFL
jgi:molybdate-binding protein/DNA-binding transcriptional regulator YhcF (GntR family)